MLISAFCGGGSSEIALALIPEAIAFSIIAGVDPKVGLYASFCIAVVIAFAGGRPGMISAATGAMALLMLLVPAQLADLFTDDPAVIAARVTTDEASLRDLAHELDLARVHLVVGGRDLDAGARPHAQASRRMMKHVSIIIPTHNRLPSLRLCLAAIAAQTYPVANLEVIVVADGCSDGTEDELSRATFAFELRVIRQSSSGAAAEVAPSASIVVGMLGSPKIMREIRLELSVPARLPLCRNGDRDG